MRSVATFLGVQQIVENSPSLHLVLCRLHSINFLEISDAIFQNPQHNGKAEYQQQAAIARVMITKRKRTELCTFPFIYCESALYKEQLLHKYCQDDQPDISLEYVQNA